MKTAIVVPNWNGQEFLAACLDSLYAQTASDFGVIVVDNGSSDGSVELVETKYPKAWLIKNATNQGFAGGVNRGIEAAIAHGAELVALFNNDAVADPDWLKNLIEAADQHPLAGIITGKFLKLDRQHLDSTGDFYSVWGFSFPRGRDELDRGQFDDPKQQLVFAGTGGASLYRVAMLQQIGLFDEDFFAYYEDVDLGFRAQLAGWQARYQPTARAYHHVGGTSSKLGDFARYHSLKNFSWLYFKNMPGWLFWIYLPRFVVAGCLMVANDLSKGRLVPLLKAGSKVIMMLPKTLLKRHKIQAAKTVTNRYIDSILYHQLPPTQKKLLGLKQRLKFK